MKLLLPLGFLMFALSFCGITDKIKQQIGESGDAVESTTKEDGGDSSTGAEKPELTAKQREIQDSAREIDWPDQGIKWKVPDDWSKMDVKKETINYGSPATGFLISRS